MIRKVIQPKAVLTDSNGETEFHQKSTFVIKTSREPSLHSETDCHCTNTLQKVTGINNTAFDLP
jgi:hypothetical protein